MLKHLVSELKETLVCLQAGQVTLRYPYEPHSPDVGFRGKVVMDTALCIGCGACAMACPPRLITLQDAQEYRTLDLQLRRCTYCARCRDVCPCHAITLSDQFETATASIDDMSITLKLKLVHCRRCGAVVGTRRALDRVEKQLVEQAHFAPDSVDWLGLCIACRGRVALETDSLMMEVSDGRDTGLVFEEIDLGLPR